jgi:hypothetical protein
MVMKADSMVGNSANKQKKAHVLIWGIRRPMVIWCVVCIAYYKNIRPTLSFRES